MSIEEKCSNCGINLESKNEKNLKIPCPNCGSLKRTILLQFIDKVTFHENIRTKEKESGKVIREVFSGEDLSTSQNKWMIKERIIDRKKDEYYEKVSDLETGEVIHDCNEPLTSHFGHGSAKYKNDNKPKTMK